MYGAHFDSADDKMFDVRSKGRRFEPHMVCFVLFVLNIVLNVCILIRPCPELFKTCFMLISTGHSVYHAHKCQHLA